MAAASARGAAPPTVIAIDGPAASGKGTLARRLADKLGLAYLDTGLLYRAVAYQALQAGVPLDDGAELARLAAGLRVADLLLDTQAVGRMRTEQTGAAASRVSALPPVRQAVGRLPRTFVEQLPAGVPGCVMDGRDVGTVLFPDARLKIFLVASAEVRAQRRLQEQQQRGAGGPLETLDQVLAAMRERDARDTARAAAPLRPADDAQLLDSSLLDPEGVFEAAMRLVEQRCPDLAQAPGVARPAELTHSGAS